MFSIDKIKILTKIKDFNGVQKSLQDIENKLNLLKDAVNNPAELEIPETKGKSGDLSVERQVDNSYKMRVRTNKGWENPVISPHYDSGWTAVSANNRYKFHHGLNSKLLLTHFYFKANGTGVKISTGDAAGNTGDIFSLNHIGIAELYNTPTNTDTGMSVFMQNSYMSIGFADPHILIHDNTHSATGTAMTKETSGHLRVFAWKIGVNL